ncbi:MAG: hypothetical protein A3A28_02455 [Candidatus Sungbacteria bacterium RIFCSPLOWO2_01_FULL_47_32]|uniref:Uncharacterized protein n=1 Tax=Candidatus Sungbacteria bacterium RIFCSPHIGHO2_01_FULL_47_32 TaxID=1802264 RepID=A0A1G2K4Q4_9BACT|nr:MAG: hypothetical protein UX72_C0016G0008 [Parcubacteria group bacterium GW2011_GWA2_47_10]OGZ94375.1 MAG: hypothetical protein A2633_02100 [Candidatus Sungbacteria bacterium RIFCSPHIGHO2_01_FULL_47_32]OGZ98352.1 MAG: hypothetical protein A3D57_02070 [Candidatus Sungbacteria bacterium RIFCSPHIGHO2_02_FULL_46_12]OHA04948.1 MAG: hypothetical protein A3A28_02455 [Candidatus Sungbacteria bacterium RIFCSPLOWO2_01_FULL_47_32]
MTEHMQEREAGQSKGTESQEKTPGMTRYRLLYQELKAEEMGCSVPNLAHLLAEEEDFLKQIGVETDMIHVIVAERRGQTLRRWGSEVEALGSLLEKDLRERIDADIIKGLTAERAR